MSRYLVGLAMLLAVLPLAACNEDQDACNAMSGNGKYSPVKEGSQVYCENHWNGDRFLLR